ncbi:MAG: hypothetical protein WAU71_08590 [Pyrinomonadaceae bacterium]
MDQLNILWKRLLSYAKADWDFEDYPVRVTESTEAEPGAAKYYARILRWSLGGFGKTRAAAVEELKTHFETFKRERPDDVLRPGETMPIEFASTEGIDRYGETAERFIKEVLGFDRLDPIFISDQSSLLDFTGTDEETADYVAQTKDVFGVDISDISDGNLLKIFERIDGKKENTQ